ncbi:MAG: biotin--[acetyl-CoA-carboxylase] ligase [Candidatus Kapabacteria bacterium]|nr:biotin--[acetyl-CoA-carboxylase] ligase [Candidatus Kapabacteria bacterium]
MIILTDNIDFTLRYFEDLNLKKIDFTQLSDNIRNLTKHFFDKKEIYQAETKDNFWNLCIMVNEADKSQYDILVELMGNNEIYTDKIICLTGISKSLHGFRNRKWVSEQGNIHLSVFLKPKIKIENVSGVFLAYAAVSTLEAIKKSADYKLEPKIKWVNDIFFENAKVAGVLAHSSQRDGIITGVILGIGINVNSKPEVEATKFVPETTSLIENAKNNNTSEMIVFKNLIQSLKMNFEFIIEGKTEKIIEEYKNNSLLIGKKVRIWSDPYTNEKPKILNEGIVTKIGNNLELFLDNSNEAIISGRPEVLN